MGAIMSRYTGILHMFPTNHVPDYQIKIVIIINILDYSDRLIDKIPVSYYEDIDSH